VLRDLVRKDIILGGRVLALNAGLFSAWFCFMLLQSDMSARAYVCLSAIMCAFLPITLIGREDKFKAQRLICSLPVTRSQVVLARYVEALLLGLVGMTVAIVMALALPWSHLQAADLLSGRTLLLAVTVVAVLVSLVLPMLQRFGLWGLIGLLVGLQVLGVVLTLLATLTKGPNPLHSAIRGLESSIVAYHVGLGAPAYAAVGMVSLFVLLTLSYAVALVAFEHRDL
jgi:ABC-type transport system involved in multi-copper enzyme maturation permease subunit